MQHFNGIPKPGSSEQYQPKPNLGNRVVLWKEKRNGTRNNNEGWYTAEQLKQNPGLVFLFGENENARYSRKKSDARGGQAGVARDFDWVYSEGKLEKQALAAGITTTFYGGYTPNLDEFKALMDSEFESLMKFVEAGGCVIVPCLSSGRTSMGTAFANLGVNIRGAPDYLNEKIQELVRAGTEPVQELEGQLKPVQELHRELEGQREQCRKAGGFKGYVERLLKDKSSIISGGDVHNQGNVFGSLPGYSTDQYPINSVNRQASASNRNNSLGTLNDPQLPLSYASGSSQRNSPTQNRTPMVSSSRPVAFIEEDHKKIHEGVLGQVPESQKSEEVVQETKNKDCCLDGKKKYIGLVIGVLLCVGAICVAAINKDIGKEGKIAVFAISSCIAACLLGGILLCCKKDRQPTKLEDGSAQPLSNSAERVRV